MQYDPHGDYIRTWLPQLAQVPTNKIQCPWTLPPKDFARYIPDGSYPRTPVLEQSNWKPHYTRRGPSKHGVPNRNERVKNPGPLIVSGGAAKGSQVSGGRAQPKNGDKLDPRERETKVIDQVVPPGNANGPIDGCRERWLS